MSDVTLSQPGNMERRYFFTLMLRSKGKQSLDLCGS